MSDKLNTKAQLSQAETDALLDAVSAQLEQETFDPNDQKLLRQMVESLGDTRGMVRLSFAEALGEIGTPATPFLLDALAHHPNPVVRRASGKTLTLIADPKAVPTLIHTLLHDEDTVVKGSVIGALARTGEASVSALLDILASSEHPESIKGHAAWALSFIGTEAKEYIYREVNAESAEVRAAVVGVLAKIAQEDLDAEVYPLLVNFLSDRSSNVRCETAAVLGNLTYRPAIAQLIEMLHHSEWESRKAAALALMKIGDRSVIESLQNALTQEPEAAVEQIIKLAISQLEKLDKEDEWD